MLSEEILAKLKERGFYGIYKETLNQRIGECKSNHRAELQDLKTRKEEGIEQDRRHRKVLNLCLSPFSVGNAEPHTLGYYFLRASPLMEHESGLKNMDFLVYNPGKGLKRPIAIFGEVKGSIESPAGTVNETFERIEVVKKYEDYIKEEYLTPKDADVIADVIFEYVIGVPVESSVRICDAIEEKGGGLIPWSAGGALEKDFLSLEIPNAIPDEIRKTMMHHDHRLTSALTKCISHAAHFTIFPQCHDVAGLQVLAEVSKRMGIEETKLEERLAEYLHYYDEKEVGKVCRYILRRGVELGIIKRTTPGRYRFKLPYTKKTDLANKIPALWVEKSIKADHLRDLAQIEEDTLAEFVRIMEKQRTLDKF